MMRAITGLASYGILNHVYWYVCTYSGDINILLCVMREYKTDIKPNIVIGLH